MVVMDIDNTLAHTWPSFLQNYPDDTVRHESLAVLYRMRNWFLKWRAEADLAVTFLSARPSHLQQATRFWLDSNGFSRPGDNLTLVDRASHKQLYFELASRLCACGQTVTVIDDLAYNHENGEVRHYHELQSYLRSSSIDYKGFEFIENIVSNSHPGTSSV